MMKRNSGILKAVFGAAFLLVLGCFPVFSQESDDQLLQELENPEKVQKKSEIDESLQKNFVVLESNSIHDLNPQTTSYSADAQILTGLYEGLFSYNPVTLDPQFAIAVDYKISRDKKRWTFKLRENARFSNGEQITAESIRNSWIQLLSNPDAPFSSLFDIVKGAENFRTGKGSSDSVGIYANADNTLSVHLIKPAAHLIRLLCHSSFSIVHRSPTVYSGPFVLDDVKDKTIILKKNPCYWDSENTHLEQITFIQSDDRSQNSYFYNNGYVDWLSSNIESKELINQKNIQMSAEFGTSYYFFKTSRAKSSKVSGQFNPWDYEEFRAAVLEAFPWDAMRKNVLIPATTFVYPLSGYPNVEGFSYTDEIEAKNLMKIAKEKYGLPEDQTIPLVFEISEFLLLDDDIEILKTSMAKIGVDLQVNKVSVYEYLRRVKKSDADLFCYTWIGDFADPLAFLELFRGDSTLNDSGWKNDKFDSLLEQAALSSDAERYVILGEAEKILLDSGMVIPIYRPVSFNVVNFEEVGGWAANAFDLHPLKYLYRKPQKTTAPNVF